MLYECVTLNSICIFIWGEKKKIKIQASPNESVCHQQQFDNALTSMYQSAY